MTLANFLEQRIEQARRGQHSHRQNATEEVMDQCGDFASVCLQREVSRIQKMHLCVWKVRLVGLRARGTEGRIMTPPRSQQPRAMLTEVSLGLRHVARRSDTKSVSHPFVVA